MAARSKGFPLGGTDVKMPTCWNGNRRRRSLMLEASSVTDLLPKLFALNLRRMPISSAVQRLPVRLMPVLAVANSDTKRNTPVPRGWGDLRHNRFLAPAKE